MYIRIEYRVFPDCVPGINLNKGLREIRDELVSRGILPGKGEEVETVGQIWWDTDFGGHYEIHPDPNAFFIRRN